MEYHVVVSNPLGGMYGHSTDRCAKGDCTGVELAFLGHQRAYDVDGTSRIPLAGDVFTAETASAEAVFGLKANERTATQVRVENVWIAASLYDDVPPMWRDGGDSARAQFLSHGKLDRS